MFAIKNNVKKFDKILSEIGKEYIDKTDSNPSNFKEYYLNIKSRLFNDLPELVKDTWQRLEYIILISDKGLKFIEFFDFYMLNIAEIGLNNDLVYINDTEYKNKFIQDIKETLNNPTVENIRLVSDKYKVVLNDLFYKDDHFGFFEKLNYIEEVLHSKTLDLKKQFNEGKLSYINNIDYNLLEYIFTTVYMAEYLVNIFTPYIRDQIDKEKGILEFLNDKRLISKYSKIDCVKEQKDNISPKYSYEMLGISQDFHIALSKKSLDILDVVNTNMLFSNLSNAFDFKKYNEQKTAELLYNYLLATHSDNQSELLTKKEWQKFQDDMYEVGGTDKAWANNMTRQVKLIIPYFDLWKIKK